MIVEVKDATVSSVWSESFTGRNGDQVEFYRALVIVPGEAPMQLGVAKDDFPAMQQKIGATGKAVIDIDARPGNRVRVYLRDLVK